MSEITREMAEVESIRRNMTAPKLLVPRTEAEWREEFEKWHDTLFPPEKYGYRCQHEDWECVSWLAALRLVGAIKEDGK